MQTTEAQHTPGPWEVLITLEVGFQRYRGLFYTLDARREWYWDTHGRQHVRDRLGARAALFKATGAQ